MFIPDLLFLIVTSIQGFDGGVIADSKVTRIHYILDSAVTKLVIQHIIKHIFLILVPDSVMSGIHSFLVFTILRILFLLVTFAFLVLSTDLWHGLETILT